MTIAHTGGGSAGNEVLEVARRAARVATSYPFKVWHFGDSVYLDSLIALAQAGVADGPEFSGYAYGLLKGWAARASFGFEDHTAPGAALVDTWGRTRDEQLLDAALQLAALWDRFPRCATAEAYLHTSRVHRNVAIDCAHFDGPFLARLAGATGENRYAEQAVYELLWRLRLLQDEGTGLCHHSYDCGRGRRGGVLWGRGQGWALLGAVETLKALPVAIDGRDEICRRLKTLLRALITFQDDSGHWHTVIDDANSYLESSVAAFFIAGAVGAYELGLVPAADVWPAVTRAWQALQRSLSSDGVLDGVSAETMTTLSPAAYRQVRTGGMYPWGQGPLVLAALAVNRLPTDPAASGIGTSSDPTSSHARLTDGRHKS